MNRRELFGLVAAAFTQQAVLESNPVQFLEYRKYSPEDVQTFILQVAKYGIRSVRSERIEIEPKNGYRCFKPGDVTVTANNGASATFPHAKWLSA